MNMQGGMGQVQMGGGGMPGGMGQGMPGGIMGPSMGGPMPGMPPNAGVMGGMGNPVTMNVPGGIMHGSSPQNPGTPGQIQAAMNQQQQGQEKLDNISKVKNLMPSLRESLTHTLKAAAQALQQNHLIDAGTIKGVDSAVPRFDKNLEEFYSICDQIELHLKTSQECVQQGNSSGRYLPYPVTPTRIEPMGAQDGNALTYPQYLNTVRQQVAYAKEIHDSLSATVQNIAPPE